MFVIREAFSEHCTSKIYGVASIAVVRHWSRQGLNFAQVCLAVADCIVRRTIRACSGMPPLKLMYSCRRMQCLTLGVPAPGSAIGAARQVRCVIAAKQKTQPLGCLVTASISTIAIGCEILSVLLKCCRFLSSLGSLLQSLRPAQQESLPL
jgi:hypothetical protein